MFTANSKLEIGPRLPSASRGDSQEFAHTIDINGDEGIGFEKSLGRVFADEVCTVIPADTESGLRQVIGAEGKKIR